MSGSIWRFAGFEYSPRTGLRRDGEQIPIGPQARRLLELLLEANGGVVSKAEIASRLWPGRPPSDDSIDRCAYLLRKPLRDAGYGDLIATAYGRGLSLRALVETLDGRARDPRQAGARLDPQVLDLWQTAYELAGNRSRDGMARAQSAIAAAGERDGASPAVWSLSADIAASRAVRGHLPPREAAAMIERDAGRALELAPQFAAALAVLGWERAALVARPQEGLGLLDRAVAMEPRYSKARLYRSWAVARLDRLDEAIEEVETGLDISPHDQSLLSLRAWLELCAGEIDGSATLARRGLQLRPDGGWLLSVVAIAASLADRHDEAEAAARRSLHNAPGDPALLSVLAYALARAGRRDEAESALAEANGDGHAAPPYVFSAAALLALGRESEALDALQSSCDHGCPWLVFAPYDPRLSPLREEILRMRPQHGETALGG